MVTGLFAGQHNTKLHGTITGVINNRKDLKKQTSRQGPYSQFTLTAQMDPEVGIKKNKFIQPHIPTYQDTIGQEKDLIQSY